MASESSLDLRERSRSFNRGEQKTEAHEKPEKIGLIEIINARICVKRTFIKVIGIETSFKYEEAEFS